MHLGKYKFTKILDDSIVPHRSGFLLIVDRDSGEIDICSSKDLYLRHRTALKGKVGATFMARYPNDPCEHLDFYYRVVTDTNRIVVKWTLQRLAGNRLLSRPVKYSIPFEQRLTMLLHKPTGFYRLFITKACNRPLTMVAAVRDLDRIRQYRHPTTNPRLRDFVQHYGPFKSFEDDFVLKEMGRFPDRTAATLRARRLAKKFGERKLLTARIL